MPLAGNGSNWWESLSRGVVALHATLKRLQTHPGSRQTLNKKITHVQQSYTFPCLMNLGLRCKSLPGKAARDSLAEKLQVVPFDRFLAVSQTILIFLYAVRIRD
jgi:hypothetical protein